MERLRLRINVVPYPVRTSILFFSVILIIADCVGSMDAMDLEAERSKSSVVGGPCEYKQYKGKAVIISITPKALPDYYTGPPYESYEVRYHFEPEEEIMEAYGKVQGREYVLRLANFRYPGLKFLRKYCIEVGKYFECYLNVITKGTCTPIIFEFSTINLKDFFENE